MKSYDDICKELELITRQNTNIRNIITMIYDTLLVAFRGNEYLKEKTKNLSAFIYGLFVNIMNADDALEILKNIKKDEVVFEIIQSALFRVKNM